MLLVIQMTMFFICEEPNMLLVIQMAIVFIYKEP